MPSTRKLILDYLHHRFPATAAELARALGLTPANIRHHLSILIKEGAIAEYAHLLTSARGRPARLYALAQQAYSQNLDGLAASLLDIFIHHYPSPESEFVLHALAQHMATTRSTSAAETTLTRRLNEAIHYLNQKNYDARWEARTHTPHIILGHCPYKAIVEQHPELCRMDAYLLEELLTIPVTQTDKLMRDQAGRTYCRFILRSN